MTRGTSHPQCHHPASGIALEWPLGLQLALEHKRDKTQTELTASRSRALEQSLAAPLPGWHSHTQHQGLGAQILEL